MRTDPTNSSWVDIYLETQLGIYSAIDKSGTSNGDFGTLQFTQIVSSTNDTNFYGLTMIPTTAAPQLKGDVNHDGIVNGQDIAVIASHWLQTSPAYPLPGDANLDGIVNGQDIAAIASHWLQSTASAGGGSGQAVPEPGSIALAIVGAALMGLRLWQRRAS